MHSILYGKHPIAEKYFNSESYVIKMIIKQLNSYVHTYVPVKNLVGSKVEIIN